MWELLSAALGVGLGVIGLTLIFGACNLLRGSRQAYDLNRRLSGKPRDVALGILASKDADVDGSLRAAHGLAYELRDDGTVRIILSSKLNTESIRETAA